MCLYWWLYIVFMWVEPRVMVRARLLVLRIMTDSVAFAITESISGRFSL